MLIIEFYYIFRSTRESYGDNAVGYVQLKRGDGMCELKCTITPEHRITKKAYLCRIVINEIEERVEMCKCEDCTASEGI